MTYNKKQLTIKGKSCNCVDCREGNYTLCEPSCSDCWEPSNQSPQTKPITSQDVDGNVELSFDGDKTVDTLRGCPCELDDLYCLELCDKDGTCHSPVLSKVAITPEGQTNEEIIGLTHNFPKKYFTVIMVKKLMDLAREDENKTKAKDMLDAHIRGKEIGFDKGCLEGKHQGVLETKEKDKKLIIDYQNRALHFIMECQCCTHYNRNIAEMLKELEKGEEK